ncbi:MAG: efflux RND transporter periplasmic adaptor subunit [Deltaproteobacteria bacterium]|nr:efflux RND transporter periplasmic adaptor subunit [Deltaproteobacteria bacterium]
MKTHLMGKILVLSLAIMIFFIFGCKDRGAKEAVEAAIPVEVVRARHATLKRYISAMGNILPRQQVVINPKVSGKIEKIYVDEGDFVRRGAPLVQLEKTDFSIALEAAEAALAEATAHLEQAERDYKRFSQLIEKKVISQQRYEEVRTAYELAQARHRSAQAALRNARTQLADTLITAPFSGYVTARFMDPGQRAYTMPPSNILEIMDISQVRLIIDIVERELPHIKIKTPVEVEVDAYPDQNSSGEVDTIYPKLDPVTRTFKVEVVIANKDARLRAGMYARVRILAQRIETLVVPRDAVMRMPATGVDYVFVIKEGKAQQRNVQTGLAEENLVEVRDGVQEGEMVVVAGQHNLRTGAKVKIRVQKDTTEG